MSNYLDSKILLFEIKMQHPMLADRGLWRCKRNFQEFPLEVVSVWQALRSISAVTEAVRLKNFPHCSHHTPLDLNNKFHSLMFLHENRRVNYLVCRIDQRAAALALHILQL